MLTVSMVKELNKALKDEGTCLRYVETFEDCGTMCYKVVVIDSFVDSTQNADITGNFEIFVRKFFKDKYNVVKTGYTNTVANIIAITEE